MDQRMMNDWLKAQAQKSQPSARSAELKRQGCGGKVVNEVRMVGPNGEEVDISEDDVHDAQNDGFRIAGSTRRNWRGATKPTTNPVDLNKDGQVTSDEMRNIS